MHQTNIEYISLTTDGSCLESSDRGLPGLNFRNFRSIKGVSWKGLQNYSELNALKLVLDINATHLKTFELSILACQYYQMDIDVEVPALRGNFISSSLLGLSDPDIKLQFPSLESLSLTGVELSCTDINIQAMISALNISALRKLRFLDCTLVVPLIQAVLKAGVKLQLDSLELEIFENSSDGDILYQNTISTFLASFEGLKELYLYTNLAHRPSDIWAALHCHRTTLERLVWHDRRNFFVDQEASCASDNSALYDMFSDKTQYPGQFPRLESVGLGTNCSFKVNTGAPEEHNSTVADTRTSYRIFSIQAICLSSIT